MRCVVRSLACSEVRAGGRSQGFTSDRRSHARSAPGSANRPGPVGAEHSRPVRPRRRPSRHARRPLSRDAPPTCVFLVDEMGLHRPVGGHAVLNAQLGRLLEVADLPSARLHVIPLSVGEHVGFGGGFVFADLPDGDRVLYLENAARGHVMDDPEMLRLIDRKRDSLLGEALPTSASMDLIRKLKVTP
ncbi:DUF5753 domain-containing protein [Micromonospora sp. NPDC051227]|uniref:DUF5753 domain-containing protein n=1 Tax=Micromonospora sp. NPDC051227 TaxID=3364285 RepID=UPI0037AAB72C